MKIRFDIISLFLVLALALTSCMSSGMNVQWETAAQPVVENGGEAPDASAPDPDAVNVRLMIGNDKEWIFKEVQSMFDENGTTVSGKKIKILYDKAGTGEAMEKVLNPESDYAGWMPASSTYVSLANEKWLESGQSGKRVSEDYATVFITPTVIAMKESLAKKMGYPGKQIGWSDILALSASKDGWGIFGDASLNPVRFAHTHPAKSNTGLNTLIAEEYAFSGKTRGLTPEDIANNSAKIKAVEQTIVHYGESTSLLKDKILAKGAQYIQYAVLYEYMVADMNSKEPGQEKTVAIYPKEGSLWADVVFTEVNNKNAAEEQKQAVAEIKKALLSDRIQKTGMDQYFFRPANTQIALSGAISEKNGVNPQEPKTVLEMPDSKIISAILEDWIKNMKKRANVTFVLDTSGSMEGDPIDNLKIAMNNIMTQDNSSKDYLSIDAQDYAGIVSFNSDVSYSEAIPGDRIGEIRQTVNGLEGAGKTRLYDAIYEALQKNADAEKKVQGKRINLVIVLTDGRDTGSGKSYEDLTGYIDSMQGELPTIITIGYGDVNKDVLQNIAKKSGGKYYDGSPEKILSIMKEIKTFF